jgi:hypothetical protein
MTRHEEAYHIALSCAADVFFDYVCDLTEHGFKELNLVTGFEDFTRVLASMLVNCAKDPNLYAAMLHEDEAGGMSLHVVSRVADYRIVELLDLHFAPAATTLEQERARVQAKFDELMARHEKTRAALDELNSLTSRTGSPSLLSPPGPSLALRKGSPRRPLGRFVPDSSGR